MKKYTREYIQPVGAMFEVTSNCNLRCSHCYVSAGESNTNLELNDDEWLFLLREILKKNVNGILITGGEPLLKVGLLKKMIDLISKYPNVQISIATNGFLLDDEFLKYFAGIPNRKLIQVSIDGAYPELHDNVRKVKGSWKKAIEACILTSNYTIELQIAHTVNQLNLFSLEEMFKLGIILGVDSLVVGAAVPLGRGYQDEDGIILKFEERKKLDSILENLKHKYESSLDTKITAFGGERHYNEYLNYYQDWLLIKSDGSVKLENRLPFIVGNVKNTSIDDLWIKVNYFQKSKQVMDWINDCINNKKEIDNQNFIFL
ncbi:radical SAM protein [Clostridium tagluense]|uniref:radical SAM protein n=1 Tax=Clostridium tagluense TaxID=360422 RepID=UPI001CF388F7|nr:radical SAM protein [Clostridium tagluense]MCB2313238.1 radical SAM protein [Clostridium tagluense]MCB2318011.1 radical SAM protein [Clostridium tagluense]MCB2322793.1 radical SAM protein [Clostridium tagluense]MCB2327795.1 radical SAM protein [Clostridium tagluense]MCB2332442.1 radical SAM protein [Clostridium tagluense]